MQSHEDQVDSGLSRDILLSDSSEEDSFSEEDLEFSLNPATGLWQGSNVRTPAVSHRRSGDALGRYGLLNTTDSTDNMETEPLIYVE